MTDRREFVASLGAGVFAGRYTLLQPGLDDLRDRFSVWAWVHGGDAEADLATWQQRYSRLRQAGVSGVLVGGGDATIHAAAAGSTGLVMHRWLWALNRSGDRRVQQEHPEWFSVSREGKSSLTHPPYVGYYKWLCPTRLPVRKYVAADVAREAATPGVAAVHLDYIRHPDVILPRDLWEKYGLVQDHEMAPYDFCYCEVCRTRFESEFGRDPAELEDAPSDIDWRRFRWRMITETVVELARAAHSQGKAISAAVFPTPTIARRLVRQEWDRWPLDVVFPMLYHSFYREPIEWIARGVAQGVAALPESTPLVAGLYLPSLDPDQLGRAIDSARSGGSAGVSIFEMGGLTDAHLAVIRNEVGQG